MLQQQPFFQVIFFLCPFFGDDFFRSFFEEVFIAQFLLRPASTSFSRTARVLCERATSSSIFINSSNGRIISAPVDSRHGLFRWLYLCSNLQFFRITKSFKIHVYFPESPRQCRFSPFTSIFFLLIGVFTSARIFRTERIVSINSFISSAALESVNARSTSGHYATVIDSPSWGRFCQISSVINGMNGCSKRNV